MAVRAITWTETGITLYARGRRPSDDYIWNAASAAWEAEVVANVADYTLQHDAFAVETPSGSYRYQVTLPAWAAGDYELEWYRRVGAAAAITDICLGVTSFEWDGAAVIVAATGTVSANLVSIMGETITGTAAWIAAAFKKFFNVETPLLDCSATPPTAGQNATAVAAAILATPGNKVKTNAAGQVEASNVTVAPVGFGGTAATYTFAGAANLAFDVPQNAETAIAGVVEDAAGDAVDLTTAELVFIVVDSAAEEVMRLTEDHGIDTTDAEAGQVTITISAEDSSASGTYKYEFWDEAAERLLAKGAFVVRATFGPGAE